MSSFHFDSDTLEFSAFCEKLKCASVSSFTADRALALAPKGSAPEAVAFQNDIKAVLNLFNKFNSVAIANDHAFYTLFKRVESEDIHYLTLEPEEYNIVKAFILELSLLKDSLESKKNILERLYPYIQRMKPDLAFAELIERTFDKDGNIKDSATPELKTIRRKISDVKHKVNHLLKDIFSMSTSDKFIQERIVVLRNGRYTIPCKSNFSQYIKAIVHDRSSSGQTVYVEPSVCVPINNELQESIIAEHQEIARILAELLAAFLGGLPVLKETIKNYTELVFRLELGAFFYKYDTVFPEFGNTIKLKKLHHPLLLINKGPDSVPVDISYNEEERLIVVSGPNTGGKTVSLKSLGLNHLIAMCGLPLFAQHADVIFFSDIRADIGDKQSLVMDLSTFSSHMTNICGIIEGIEGKALVLFDELGTGTDPKEGAALAIAILEYLRQKDAYVMLTTHFSELKAYAFDRDDAKIYAVGFDYETFIPQYNLLEGVAGSSDPILIARRIGFPESVTEEADKRMKGYKSTSEMALEEINLMRAEAEHTKRRLAEREKALEQQESQVNSRQVELKERLSKKELELLEESFALLQRSKRLADERIKDTPESIAHDLKDVGEKIKELKSHQKSIKDIGVGDTIFLEKYGKIAKILSLDGKTAQIDLEGIKVKLNRQDLVGYKTSDTKPKPVKISSGKNAAVRRELLLVGKRVEEAIDMLDKYIDESHNSGYDKVFIIHGRGSGQLRRAVQDFLRTSGRIKNCATATHEEGGEAVTVVNL